MKIELHLYLISAAMPAKSRYFAELRRIDFEATVPLTLFDKISGGHHLTVLLDPNSRDGFSEYVGVHGRRKISKIRALLKKHSIDTVLLRECSWAERCEDNAQALTLFQKELARRGLPPVSHASSCD